MIEKQNLENTETEIIPAIEDKYKTERKQPIDMKLFWKTTDEVYYKRPKELNIDQINHLITNLSNYDIKQDSSLVKYGFPRNLDNFTGKSIDLIQKKNNPFLVSNFFGMYIYIDKYDHLINNINTGDINDEIDEIDNKLVEIEKNNLDYIKKLKKFINTETDSFKLDLYDPKIDKIKIDNISNQIFTLQMKQLSECISTIKRDKQAKLYYIVFDKSENIRALFLDEATYKYLMKQRDTSISVYDLFQEKISSVYNKKVVEKPRKNKKYIKGSKAPPKEKIQIATNTHINYDFCHHCKQKKPAEIMMKCESSNFNSVNKNYDKNFRYFSINGIIACKKFKNFIITNFQGDPKEIVDEYLNAEYTHFCERFYCNYCLKGNYEINVDLIKSKKDWICPCCDGSCFCSRCKRNDQLLKLVSLYISLEGDLKDLETYLMNQSPIIKPILDCLLISNLTIIIYNPITKKYINVEKIDSMKKKQDQNKENKESYPISYKETKAIVGEKEKFTNLRDYFSQIYLKNKELKILQSFEQKCEELSNVIGPDKILNFHKKKRTRQHSQNLNRLITRDKIIDDATKQKFLKQRKNNIKFCLRTYTRMNLRIRKSNKIEKEMKYSLYSF